MSVLIYIENKCHLTEALGLSAEFRRNVALYDSHCLEFLQPYFSGLFLVVPPEVLDILGVGQVFLLCIVSMEFLKVVNLVFILHVTMVARSKSEVGQSRAIGDCFQPVFTGNKASVPRIEEVEDRADGGLFTGFAHTAGGFVVETVCLAYLVDCPCPRGIVIVKHEE